MPSHPTFLLSLFIPVRLFIKPSTVISFSCSFSIVLVLSCAWGGRGAGAIDFRPNPLTKEADTALMGRRAMLHQGPCPVCREPLPDEERGILACVSILFTLPSSVLLLLVLLLVML